VFFRVPSAPFYESIQAAEKWAPVSNRTSKNYFIINSKSKMGDQPHKEGIQFWKTTPYH